MYCPNCGTSEQTPGAYCRSCGEFVVNASDKFYLIRKILGINTPEKQLNISLVINLLTAICGALLVIFLMGYFDGRFNRTGESAPSIIYLVYVFLGLISAWQFVNVISDLVQISELTRRRNALSEMKPREPGTVLSTAEIPESLPPATFTNVPSSVTDQTTKKLKIPR